MSDDECFCGHPAIAHTSSGCQGCADYGPGTCNEFQQDDGRTINGRVLDKWGIGLREPKRTWWERLLRR